MTLTACPETVDAPTDTMVHERVEARRRGRVWKSPRSLPAADERVDARRGRVWKAPRPPHASDERPRGATAVALVTAGAMALGGAAIAHLDDGPVAPERPVVAMHDVAGDVGAHAAWSQGITGAGVNVAVIDTGIAPVAELTGNVVAAVDMTGDAPDPSAAFGDAYGHGTHMAGIIAGRSPQADPARAAEHPEWFMGIAPDAGLVSVKVADATGAVTGPSLVAGIDWVVANAAELDVSVLTLAFDGGDIESYRADPVAAALERAWDAGIVVVTAAGNRGTEGLASAARSPFAIAVAGVDTGDGTVPSWASVGDDRRAPDLAAPGAHIASLRAPGSDADLNHPEGFVDDVHFLGSGSSQGAAVTAGAVALLLQDRPELTADQVKAILVESAAPFDGPADRIGSGLLAIDRALDLPAPQTTQTWERTTTDIASPLAGTIAFETSGAAWAGAAWAGAAWAGAAWAGAAWAGAAWAGAAWAGAAWAGAAWAGAAWAGAAWAGAAWA